MPKGFFLSLPSISVSKTLLHTINELVQIGHEMIYFNTESFRPAREAAYKFRPYPETQAGFNTQTIDADISLFQLGESLIDTTSAVMDFLLEEVKREKPDYILHSHLATWGKLLAQKVKLPAVSLYTTFMLDKEVVRPHLLSKQQGMNHSPQVLAYAKQFYTKSQKIYARMGIDEVPDIWEVYVNREKLNVSYILESFQPSSALFSDICNYVGFPISVDRQAIRHEQIYVSMGTIFNKDKAILSICMDVLEALSIPAVISSGNQKQADLAYNRAGSGHIRLLPFVKQIEELHKSSMFITHGGMASVQEAVYTLTPMIVIPSIPEQEITAKRIEELGIGIYLPRKELNRENLKNAIQTLMHNHKSYVSKLNALVNTGPTESPARLARNLINNYLQKEKINNSPSFV